jgi:hypothetical protein
VVEGDRFLTEQTGTIDFRFSGRTISGQVQEWQDDYVSVILPEDTEGLGQVDGIVKLTNHRGYEATRSISFEPTMASRTFREHHKAIAIVFGQRKDFEDHDHHLTNGWQIKDVHLETKETGFGGGCRYVHEPSVGGTATRSTGQVWADVFGRCDCINYLTIEGPKGLDYE